jgi:hypothetical protein
MVVHLARDDATEVPVPTPPLHWWSVTEGPLISGPQGQLGNLARHGVHANGEVYPSVLVSGGDPAKDVEWHDWVVLDGWDRGERAER